MACRRRVEPFLPVLLVGAVMVHRFVFQMARPYPVSVEVHRTPLWLDLPFLIVGVFVLVVAVLRIFGTVRGHWVAVAAAAVAVPYVAYAGWLVSAFPYWRIGGVMGEFMLIPVLVGWTWGQRGVKDLRR